MMHFTSQEFNQNPGKIKKAAASGPVIVTERGKNSLVVLAFADYKKLSGRGESLLDALSMPGLADIAFDPTLPAGFPAVVDFD